MNTKKRQLKGVVLSDKMQKTVVVAVSKMKENPLYRKIVRTTKKYKAHDEHERYKVGDVVIIEECRPLSKEKKWMVKKLITHNS